MKKLISATLAASLALSLAACGSSASTDSVAASSEAASTESTAASSEAAESTAETSELAGTTLKVAASPTPHAEILNAAKDILAEQGIDLEVIEFTEYVPVSYTHLDVYKRQQVFVAVFGEGCGHAALLGRDGEGVLAVGQGQGLVGSTVFFIGAGSQSRHDKALLCMHVGAAHVRPATLWKAPDCG